MRKLRLLVVLLVVLSLLVAVSASVSADKPPDKGKPAKKEKVKKKPAPAVHVPPGQAKRQQEMADATPEPDDDDPNGDGPTMKYWICHKPGTPAEKTLAVPADSIPDHLGHGDQLGACDEQSPSPPVSPTEPVSPTVTPTTTVTPTATWKIAICHKPNTPAEKTLYLPPSAMGGHLGHGDYLGTCISATPTVTPTATTTPTVTVTPTETVTPTMTPTATWKISICHKPNTPAEQTLYLPPSAIPGHERHGDYLGTCISASPPVSPTETVTPTATATEEPTGEPEETPEASAAGTVEFLVCHNPYAPDQETLTLAPSAVPEHLAHGDLPGSCDDLPAETWARRLAAAFLRRLGNPW